MLYFLISLPDAKGYYHAGKPLQLVCFVDPRNAQVWFKERDLDYIFDANYNEQLDDDKSSMIPKFDIPRNIVYTFRVISLKTLIWKLKTRYAKEATEADVFELYAVIYRKLWQTEFFYTLYEKPKYRDWRYVLCDLDLRHVFVPVEQKLENGKLERLREYELLTRHVFIPFEQKLEKGTLERLREYELVTFTVFRDKSKTSTLVENETSTLTTDLETGLLVAFARQTIKPHKYFDANFLKRVNALTDDEAGNISIFEKRFNFPLDEKLISLSSLAFIKSFATNTIELFNSPLFETTLRNTLTHLYYKRVRNPRFCMSCIRVRKCSYGSGFQWSLGIFGCGIFRSADQKEADRYFHEHCLDREVLTRIAAKNRLFFVEYNRERGEEMDMPAFVRRFDFDEFMLKTAFVRIKEHTWYQSICLSLSAYNSHYMWKLSLCQIRPS